MPPNQKTKLLYQPKPGFQQEALWDDADFLLLGGQAGPGKSWILTFSVLFLDQGVGKEPVKLFDIPNYRAIIFRRQSKHVEELLDVIASPIYNHFGGTWRGSPHDCFTFPSGAKISIGHMNNISDWTNYRGNERQTWAFDEVCEFEEQQVAGILPWVRSTIPGVRARFIATANPEGVGLDWVKNWWEIKCPCPEHKGVNNTVIKKIPELPGSGLKFRFIPGSRAGSHMEAMNPNYEQFLAVLCGGINSPRFKALARGCWEVAKGAFFGEFDRNIHVIPNDFKFSDKWNWLGYGGHDFASSPQGDASAFVQGKVNQNRDVLVENELYGWGKGVIEQAQGFMPLLKECEMSYSGSDIFSENQGGEIKNIASQFLNDTGVEFIKAKLDIMNTGAIIRNGLLATINSRSGAIFIRERCKRLIEDFEKLLTNPKKFDEWDSTQRITVDNHRYHFDVFQAFCIMYSGIISSDILPDKSQPMSDRRKKNIFSPDKTQEEQNCSYSTIIT